ncbi:hypothetical protein B0A50_02013 [Salinomyces thailandicus]|uniref:Transcription factor domain-containing protein n=1 Tax=Salinomyces thailandicus TaxID=706561 RepID=A0A4U0U9U9_9PEZI|nr:hypothetical protein B0A50_02013 [Salinomyces thailandica]
MQAKDMGLHLTDSLHNKRPEETREQIIDAEMRRRVWWHLASTDWSTSLAGSPHEGTYSVQVKHMQVRRPRNITDEDLATQPADFSRPVEEATANSYYLQRISLAEVCREAADLLWDIYAVRDPEQIEYDRVKQLDAKFAGLLDNLPNALRLDHLKGGDQRTESVTTNHLMKQSHFTYLTVEVRRSKVHLPFLLRAERDHRYAFSRTQCLASARNVLALRHVLPHEQSSSGGPVFLIGVLHHFFCAMVVLVMDVCVNKAAGHEEERRQEVKEACGILERARERSSVANTFLESLMTILKKHGVRCQNPTAPPVSTGFAAGWGTAAGINDFTSTTPILADPNLAVDGVMSDTLNFDDLWQSYFDMGPQLDPESWNDIFNDLEMRVDP